VELLLKSDLAVVTDAGNSDSFDAGALLKEGLNFLANCPFEALDINLASQTIDVRKAYKRLALKYHPDKVGVSFHCFVLCYS
jgi:DnaJ-class molecular chaperone